MFEGLLLKESLQDESALDALSITSTEIWQVERPADFQPVTWTAIAFAGAAAQADAVAERLSRALKPRWYANMSTATHSIVIFKDRVFKYPRGDAVQRAEAQQHAIAAGVPEWQVDWGE